MDPGGGIPVSGEVDRASGEVDRASGEDARWMNLLAARVVVEAVKSTFGPRCMEKMIVTSEGEIAVTDNSAVLLSLLPTRHPIAKIIGEVAGTQREEIGDGTTTAVLLLGALLGEAEKLLREGLHPTTIVRGYTLALERALGLLEKRDQPLSHGDLERIGRAVLGGKVAPGEVDHLVSLALRAVEISERVEDVVVLYRPGEGVLQSELIQGMIIDLGKGTHPGMPKRVEGASILLIDREFTVKKSDYKAEIRTPATLRAFREFRRKVLWTAVEMVRKSGARVLFSQKDIDPIASSYLSQAGILAVRDVEREAFEGLAKATGGRIVTNVREVAPTVLGSADLVEERKIGREDLMAVHSHTSRSAALLIRAGSENVALEIRRRMEDLLRVLFRCRKDGRGLPGGGGIEVSLADDLRAWARAISGKEQLAVEAFASALEDLPKTLASNAGLDPITLLAELRSQNQKGSRGGYGIDLRDGKVKKALEAGIIDPSASKRQALQSATEGACMILRIDDVLVSRRG
jgi:chaperonin GroEL (HSP60 family)